MPPRRSQTSPRLSNALVLAPYLLHLLGDHAIDPNTGKPSLDVVAQRLADLPEGVNDDGRTVCCDELLTWSGLDPYLFAHLEAYDERIRGYMEHLNRKRKGTPIELKYFQYLPVLLTEYYLDRHFHDRSSFLREMTAFCWPYAKKLGHSDYVPTKASLTRIAIQMATGSGKTHLIAINYLQFLHYNRGPNQIPIENVLLITPNETLSKQHLEELDQSDVPAALYLPDVGLGLFDSGPRIQVTEITKFRAQTSGKGVSIDLRSFGDRNLIFVDEAHRGSSGKTWHDYRDDLARRGFTFDYSATLEQAVNGNADLTRTYAQSLVFNYPYHSFYRDGYGKDYLILNVHEQDDVQDLRYRIMIANLLSFYEQVLVYTDHPGDADEYNIEPPLWCFVGTTVTGVKGKETETSDVHAALRFFHRVLAEPAHAIATIEGILSGQLAIRDKAGKNLYAPDFGDHRLRYLRARKVVVGQTGVQTYNDMLNKIFHVAAPGPLTLHNLVGQSGEIGLKVGVGNTYFGVVNVGEDARLLKIIEEAGEIHVGADDPHTGSLFDGINRPGSIVNILVGAKKFMEGWSSWRVSTIGLLNVGRREGTQIVQLFGRGVRLRGRTRGGRLTLKRSSAEDGEHPPHLSILETLNIFGIEANYMEAFRDIIEEINPPSTFVTYKIKSEPHPDLESAQLVVISYDRRQFKNECIVALPSEPIPNLNVVVDRRSRAQVMESRVRTGVVAQSQDEPVIIDPLFVEAFDWTHIYDDLAEFRRQKEWYNLTISVDALKAFIVGGRYELYLDDLRLVHPSSFSELKRAEEIVVDVLKAYLARFYARSTNQYGKEKGVKTSFLNKDHRNIAIAYSIQVDKADNFLLSEIQDMVTQFQEEHNEQVWRGRVHNITFPGHLYQPLLAMRDGNGTVKMIPTGLNKGEVKFVEDLKTYIENKPASLEGKSIYLLRNLPKRGVGFYVEPGNFYPDFVIWIVDETGQHIIFADPKGLGWIEGPNDPKLKLRDGIHEYESRVSKDSGVLVTLDSFIISIDPPENVHTLGSGDIAHHARKNHVLFQQGDERYIDRLIDLSLSCD